MELARHSSLQSRPVVARGPDGQPRTDRRASHAVDVNAAVGPAVLSAREAAYRRLAVAILGLDLASLSSRLRASRAQLARSA